MYCLILFLFIFPSQTIAQETSRIESFHSSPYDKSIQLNSEGIKYWEGGNFQSALDNFVSASQLEPKIGEYHFNQGIALYKKGQNDKGLQVIQKAFKLKNFGDPCKYGWCAPDGPSSPTNPCPREGWCPPTIMPLKK